MQRRVISISQLNNYVRNMLEEDHLLSNVWVCGEISNCKQYPSGHIYFTLKDEGSSISAVMFNHNAKGLTFQFREGMSIFAKCSITIYVKEGRYQANVTEAERQGLGVLHERFEQLKHQLHAQGLFNYKKPIPKYPKSVGIITSHKGAALQDMLKVAARRNKNIPIYIYPASVQGELAKGQLVEQIRRANEDNLVDVLIIGRGGGSIEDLWPFNEECVARAIAASKIPTISAVGHEVDTTIADYVSDRRAATPSVAAELAFPSLEELSFKLENYKRSLSTLVRNQLTMRQDKLKYLVNRPAFKHKTKHFEQQLQLVDNLTEKLRKQVMFNMEHKNTQYVNIIRQLEKLSPYKTLARGYSYTVNQEKKLISSINDVEIGNNITISVSDGDIGVCVTSK